MGKVLPSVNQWLKVLRGGLSLPEGPNPDPTRKTPWPTNESIYPANIDAEDAFSDLAPVGSFSEDKSPYGPVDLAGNVSEWTRDDVELQSMQGLRYVVGSNWDTPRQNVSWRNMRPARFLDFGIGIRCVVPE
jgi:eukaryotic-like serine/threonine-protein kinase